MAVKLYSLQALRGLAASTVVVSHLMRQTHEDWVHATAPDLYALALGDLGVFLFFIISGFIMQHTAGGTFGQAGAARQFFERRIARIVPLYWMFTALAVAFPGALYLGTHRTAVGVICSFAYLPDISLARLTPVLPVGWTLSFEMLFYLIFGVCLNFRRRTGIAFVFIGLIGFVLLMQGIAHMIPAVRDFAQWWGRPLLAWFAVGVLFAIVRASGPANGQMAVAGFALGMLLFSAVVLRAMLISDSIGMWLSLAPVPVVALCTLLGDVPDNELMRPFIWLGDRSYTLYLGHLFVLGISSAAWLRVFGARWPLAYDAVTLCLCLLLCSPVYRFELRLTKLARTFLSTRIGAIQAPVPTAWKF